ncbi:MAG: hypothetical protein EA412_06270 [Chitinophagaceae bacterium]|nr:MAG: hypothetical protein EA412_06270 [Chitinophagaceae bacterium]
MIVSETHHISGSDGKTILIDVKYSNKKHPLPIIVFCHGFKGFKDWGHFNLIADFFAQNGYVFVKFNFSHNGTRVDSPESFTDLEAFSKNNFSKELFDTEKVVDFVCTSEFRDKYNADLSNLILMGHSRGGGIAILQASGDERIKALITLSAIEAFGKYWSKEQMDKWKREGVMYIKNARTNQELPMDYQMYEDFYRNKDRLDIPKAAGKMNCPWLIVHAKDDSTIPFNAAENMHKACEKSELMLLDEGGHTFGGKHPWLEDELPAETKEIVGFSLDFLKKSL